MTSRVVRPGASRTHRPRSANGPVMRCANSTTYDEAPATALQVTTTRVVGSPVVACTIAGAPRTVTVAVRLSSEPQEEPTRTQKFVVTESAGVVKEAVVAPAAPIDGQLNHIELP